MRVFISSTTSGLGSYRRFAAEFLKDWHNVEPVLQEGLTGDHASAVTYLGRLITSCDRVICLIGPYSGSCPSDQPPDQRRSYTQMEYDIANRSGLLVHILDGRQCQLDPGCQSAEECQLQEAFWKEVERLDRRLRPEFHDKAHLSQLLLRLIKDWEGGQDSLRSLPTPFFLWRRRLQDRASALASFGEMLDFVVCMAAAEVNYPEPLPITEVDDLLEHASQKGFVTELRYLEFVDYLKWHKQAALTRVPPSLKDITSRFETAMQLLRVLEMYLLVRVERHDFGVRLRVYRGPTPAWENYLQSCESFAQTSYQGELHLLDTRRRESLRLSPYLQPLPEEPDILCVWWRESSEEPVQLLPFANLHDPVRAPHPGPSLAFQTALLATHSWCTLAQHYPPGDRQVGEYCGDWRIIGAATETRNLVQLFLATRDDPTDLPAGLWRAKDGLDETARRRIGEQFHRWYDYASLELELVGRVLHFEPGKRPAIVAAIPPGMRPLSRFLAPGAPPMDPNDQPLRRLVCGVVKLCRFLASQGVRLIHCSPADLYWDGEEQCQLVGVGSTLADGEYMPQDRALLDILGGDEPPIVAPELALGVRASIASEMFAIGVLLQRCRRQTPPMPLPAGDRNDVQDANMRDGWRNDPLDCFVFHCLARHPHRRFISWENFLSYFNICTAPNAVAWLTEPEMIFLRGGLRISRCQVSNFQYERFCHDRRQDAPAQSLPWNYATPFAPVVAVSVGDCEDYCAWLGEQYGGRWRLPTAAEWLAAAGTESFPWGSEAPNPTLANYCGACRGPTVVGAYPCRDHGGLRDMAGNVWEWCCDRTPDGPWRVLKGGSFASPGSYLQVKKEDYRVAGGRYVDVGFRVVQEGGN